MKVVSENFKRITIEETIVKDYDNKFVNNNENYIDEIKKVFIETIKDEFFTSQEELEKWKNEEINRDDLIKYKIKVIIEEA